MADDLADAFKNVSSALRKREGELDEREKALKKLKTSLEKENPNLGKPSDVLRLNIGGEKTIDILRRTLTQCEHSMLASKFSGRWDDSLEKDKDGNFLIDQPPKLFLPLVNFLRALSNETPLSDRATPPPLNPPEYRDFIRMLEYYGMTLGVYRMGIYHVSSPTRKILVSNGLDYNIDSDDWATYCIVPFDVERNSHNRLVKSFEVTLGVCSAAQIGWIDCDTTNNNQTAKAFFASEQGRGVGFGAPSMALDCVRSAMAVDGNVVSVLSVDVSVKSGTKIRSENRGEHWYLNGTLITSLTQHGGDVLPFAGWNNSFQVSPETLVPCLSIKGSCHISAIELDFWDRPDGSSILV